MNLYYIAKLVVVIGLSALMNVSIGKPRKPMTSGVASAIVLVDAIMIWVILN